MCKYATKHTPWPHSISVLAFTTLWLVHVSIWVIDYRINFYLSIYYKAEKPSVCLSVRLHFTRHADNSVVCASIETRLARNDCYVFWHQQVYFKFLGAIVFRQRSVEDTHVEKKRPLSKKVNGSNPGEVIFLMNAVTFS